MGTLNRLMMLGLSMMPLSQVNAFELKVHGVVTEYLSGEVITNALVRVYKDGVKQQAEETGILGLYAVKLENNARYIIRFSAPGHQTKCFSVDTHGLAWEGENRLKDLFVEMTLFERISDMDLSYFDLPMGMARFQPATGLVTWDEEYDARIRAEVQAIMEEYERRMTATADATASRAGDNATIARHTRAAR